MHTGIGLDDIYDKKANKEIKRMENENGNK